MKNVLFPLAPRLGSWGKERQRGRQGLIPFRDQSEISTLLFLDDPAKASTVLVAAIPAPLSPAVDEALSSAAAAVRANAPRLYPKAWGSRLDTKGGHEDTLA